MYVFLKKNTEVLDQDQEKTSWVWKEFLLNLQQGKRVKLSPYTL